MPKAVALLSGGLDSTLAVLLMRRQNIEITAITFLMHFGCDMSDTSSCSSDSTSNAERFGFTVKLCHLADKFTSIVKNPKFGHGKNMNPCVDCRVLMLREAAEFMRMTGADFLVTGEVIGQRPMSQRQNIIPIIDREAGVEGMVLRPLSAKLMKPTLAETGGLVDREQLMDIRGRSRKPQMTLARELGLTDYPAPGGGCLLTEPNYSLRLSELLKHTPNPELVDLHLLRLGRHFRLPGGAKAIVGRHEQDNAGIEVLATPTDVMIDIPDYGSPLTILRGAPPEEDIMLAASITARYTSAKGAASLNALVTGPTGTRTICVPRARDEEIDRMRIVIPDGMTRKQVKV